MFWDVSVDSLLSAALEIKFPRNAHGETWLRLYPVAALASIFRALDFKFKVSQEVFINHVVYAAMYLSHYGLRLANNFADEGQLCFQLLQAEGPEHGY